MSWFGMGKYDKIIGYRINKEDEPVRIEFYGDELSSGDFVERLVKLSEDRSVYDFYFAKVKEKKSGSELLKMIEEGK